MTASTVQEAKQVEISLELIEPNAVNPRSIRISDKGLGPLTASILRHGVLEPILIRPKGDRYEIVVGERRYRAAILAGLETVPVIIRNSSDAEVIELTLVENIQREDLTAVDKAHMCVLLRKQLPELFKTWDDVALRLGVGSPTVRSWIRTIKLPTELQAMIASCGNQHKIPAGMLDFRTALDINRRIPDPTTRLVVARQVAGRSLSRREKEQLINAARESPTVGQAKSEPPRIKVEPRAETRPTLVFNHRHYQATIRGDKNQTIRRRPIPGVDVGSMVRAAVNHFADLRVTEYVTKRLGELTELDAMREGGYTLEQFRTYWERINGAWDSNETVYILRFEVDRVR